MNTPWCTRSRYWRENKRGLGNGFYHTLICHSFDRKHVSYDQIEKAVREARFFKACTAIFSVLIKLLGDTSVRLSSSIPSTAASMTSAQVEKVPGSEAGSKTFLTKATYLRYIGIWLYNNGRIMLDQCEPRADSYTSSVTSLSVHCTRLSRSVFSIKGFAVELPIPRNRERISCTSGVANLLSSSCFKSRIAASCIHTIVFCHQHPNYRYMQNHALAERYDLLQRRSLRG